MQVQQAIKLLNQSEPSDRDDQLMQLVAHCKKWDKVYGLNAIKLYPELAEIFEKYDY
jgi:hypothetical protein